eukprot:6187195-Pleurochrysis_carterae.AAC.3
MPNSASRRLCIEVLGARAWANLVWRLAVNRPERQLGGGGERGALLVLTKPDFRANKGGARALNATGRHVTVRIGVRAAGRARV